jgi:hypothetical protein
MSVMICRSRRFLIYCSCSGKSKSNINNIIFQFIEHEAESSIDGEEKTHLSILSEIIETVTDTFTELIILVYREMLGILMYSE